MVDLVVLDPLSSEGWTAKQKGKVAIGEVDSGSERRVRKWPVTRREYNIPYRARTAEKWIRLMEFHELRGTTERGFLIWDIYRAYIQNERIGTGNGTNKTFQLTKTIADAANAVVRTIRYPVPTGTPLPINVRGQAIAQGLPQGQTTAQTIVTVAGSPRTEGTQFTVSLTTGAVTFATAPPAGAAVVVTFFAYVPVRFLDEEMSVETMSILGDNESALIELLNE